MQSTPSHTADHLISALGASRRWPGGWGGSSLRSLADFLDDLRESVSIDQIDWFSLGQGQRGRGERSRRDQDGSVGPLVDQHTQQFPRFAHSNPKAPPLLALDQSSTILSSKVQIK